MGVLIWKINTSIWFQYKEKKSLMEDKENTRYEGSTLVGTPKAHPTCEFIIVA